MADSNEQYFNDRLLASAARFLIDGGERDEATLLLSCTLSHEVINQWQEGEEINVILAGPRSAFVVLADYSNSITQSIHDSIRAIVPHSMQISAFIARGSLISVEEGWRNELLDIARGKTVHNQGLTTEQHFTWMDLHFRSPPEISVAQALEKAGVLFFPNCRARLNGGAGTRTTREPDFLICDKGRWGILEVDGETYHPPSRTTQDHERDRLFKAHGIRVVEHFDAQECKDKPDLVVKRFLNILAST